MPLSINDLLSNKEPSGAGGVAGAPRIERVRLSGYDALYGEPSQHVIVRIDASHGTTG
jgi:hypothetical protein